MTPEQIQKLLERVDELEKELTLLKKFVDRIDETTNERIDRLVNNNRRSRDY